MNISIRVLDPCSPVAQAQCCSELVYLYFCFLWWSGRAVFRWIAIKFCKCLYPLFHSYSNNSLAPGNYPHILHHTFKETEGFLQPLLSIFWVRQIGGLSALSLNDLGYIWSVFHRRTLQFREGDQLVQGCTRSYDRTGMKTQVCRPQ